GGREVADVGGGGEDREWRAGQAFVAGVGAPVVALAAQAYCPAAQQGDPGGGGQGLAQRGRMDPAGFGIELGLVQAEELADLDARLDAAADALRASAETDLPEPVTFEVPAPAPLQRSLEGVRIGVARDASFAFLYQANLDLLRELGAELAFFSPLQDQALPAVDSLYLPGGYPELHLGRLQGNRAMAEAIRAHHAAGKPLLAECGGMLYLLDCLEDADGERGELLGLLPGRARLQKRLTALALQEVELPEGRLRGHTFHHSTLDCAVEPLARGVCPNGRNTAEAVFRLGRLTASYIHFYLPSNPQAAAALLAPARDAD
ncbi:hypothetical protein P9961_032485, partial [Pseudomonas aeruginosa]|nr:hypothetical protein [Pseudomonas aeruginosa]